MTLMPGPLRFWRLLALAVPLLLADRAGTDPDHPQRALSEMAKRKNSDR